MRTIQKFLFLLLASVLVMGIWSFATAETITKTGWSQRALYNFLNSVLTLDNEVKSDHNAVLGSYSTVRKDANATKTAHNGVMNDYSTTRANYSALQTKYNVLFNKMSTLNYRVMHAASFADMTGSAASKIILGNQRATANPAATVLTSTRVTGTSDSTVLVGKRTTSTDVSFSGN